MALKILHINTSQKGGAALCAMRINKALVQQEVESKMLFAEGKSMPEGIDGAIAKKDITWSLRKYKLFRKTVHALMRLPWYHNAEKLQVWMNQSNVDGLFISQPLSYYKNIAYHPLVRWADIIHLHWVPNFVDYSTFFKKVGKPIVWTLHDKYPAEGLQHYNSDFSPVPENLKEIDTFCKKIKRQGVQNAKNLHVVAISKQMELICKKSEVLNGFPCTLINNGVDCSVFHYSGSDRQSVLSKYTKEEGILKSIKLSTKIFMFSAYWIWDNNKGLQKTINALECINDNDLLLLVIGNNGEVFPYAKFPIICTGFIRSQDELVDLYSISDYFILASNEESFAQTPLEAMACGTPVICTPCSGAEDLLRTFNGIICDGFDSSAIAAGIEQALKQEFNKDIIRQYIFDNFDFAKISKKYISLYKSIL